MPYDIIRLEPELDAVTTGVDEPWRITAGMLDDDGEPLIDPQTGEQVTVTASWWTSGAWNFYPPQAYDPQTGNRHAQWEDPAGSGQMTSSPRLATREEIEPVLREILDQVIASRQQ